MEKSDGDMVKAAVSILTAALIKDKGFRLSWQCNIAQAMLDEVQPVLNEMPLMEQTFKSLSNKVANRFLTHLCQTKFEVL
jgi:hypothetical protein